MKALSFEGSGSEYFQIWIVNVLLTIVTLGLYYPWAKVRNHRYFHANSVLEGKNFEYHATGKQLFFAYLIAMAIFILYMVAVQVSPMGAIIFPLVLFLAIPWLIWRSLKFNMRITSFSNVRFGFKGTAGAAYVNFFLYPFIFLLAIYIVPIGTAVLIPKLSAAGSVPTWIVVAAPIAALASIVFAIYMFAFMKKKNVSYVINGSRFGQGIFSTELETKKFLMITLKTLGVSIVVMTLAFIILAALAAVTVGLSTVQAGMNNPAAMGPIIAVMYVGVIFASMFIIAYSVTRQRTYIYKNSTLDNDIQFESTLKAKELSWMMVTNLLMIMFTFGLAFPWAKVRMARLTLENTLVSTSGGFNEYMTQKQSEESSLGEQIGDAFDVDVGLGL